MRRVEQSVRMRSLQGCWVIWLVALVHAADEVATMRPCSEADVYVGWPRVSSERSAEPRPAPALKGCSQLILSSVALSAEEALVLAQAVDSSGAACNSTTPCVRQLDALLLDGTPIGDEGATVLAGALAPDEPLAFNVSLVLSATGIGAVGGIALAAALRSKTSTLSSVSLNWNEELGDDGAAAIGNALVSNVALRELRLARCSIGDTGAARLGIGLQGRSSALHTLELEGNVIGPAGAQALGTALKTNAGLDSLGLALNPLGANGAAALALGLRHNTNLTSLNLAGCELGDDGAEALALALRGNEVLRSLNLQDNGIGRRGGAALASMLRINRALRHVNLRLNQLGEVSATALLDSITNGEAALFGNGSCAVLLEHNRVSPPLPGDDSDELMEAPISQELMSKLSVTNTIAVAAHGSSSDSSVR